MSDPHARCAQPGDTRSVQLLRGEWPDPDGGAADRRADRGDRDRAQPRGIEADLVAPLGLGRRLAVVRDPQHARRARRTCRARARAAVRDRRVGPARRRTARRRGDRRARCAPRCATRRAGGRRLGNDQRPLQVRRRAGRQAVRGVRDRAVDERLHVVERGDHRRRAQEVAAAAAPLRRVHRPRRAVRGARADDPRRPRRFAVPLDRAGRLAAVASPARNAVPARAVRAAGRRRAGAAGRSGSAARAAISTRCARSRARWCCPASA